MKILIGIILFLTPVIVFAQDTTKFHITYSSTGSYNKTQSSNSFLFNNVLDLLEKNKSIAFNLSGTYLYGRQNSITSNRDISTILNFDYFKSPPIKNSYYWCLLEYSSSLSLKVNTEKQFGFGFAFILINNPTARLTFSDGVIYDQNNVLLNNLNINHDVIRNSFRIRYHFLINNIFNLAGLTYYQTSLEKNDFIIKSTQTAGVKLNNWLSVGSSLTFNKYAFIQRENLLLTYGLIVDKSF